MYVSNGNYGVRPKDGKFAVSTPDPGRPPSGSVVFGDVAIGGSATELRELAKVLEDLAMEVDAVEQGVPA